MREYDLSDDGDAEVESERPPRKLLPNKEQINAIDDVSALETLSSDLLIQITKIETDLDFRDGDDDWHARARGALTAHHICRKLVEHRLHVLRRGARAAMPPPSEAKLEKTRLNLKKQEEMRVIATERKEREKLLVERERQAKSLAATRRIAQAIRDTSLGHSFLGLAAKMLPPDVFQEVLHAARKEVEEKAAELLKNKYLSDVSEVKSTSDCSIDQKQNAPTVEVEAFNPRM